MKPIALTQRHINLLRHAINRADSWIGGTDPTDWPELKAEVAEMREALAIVRKFKDVVPPTKPKRN